MRHLVSSAMQKWPEAHILISRQLYWPSGQPAPHLLPPKAANVKTGTFNLTKGQAFVSDLLLTGETAIMNASDSKHLRCDALALEGGLGGQPKVQLLLFCVSTSSYLMHCTSSLSHTHAEEMRGDLGLQCASSQQEASREFERKSATAVRTDVWTCRQNSWGKR